MKLVSVETPEKSVCKMTFSATAEELEAASNAVYERTRATYTIKGFQKGEADRAQIEADRGEHTFWYDAINDLMDQDVPALYEAALKEHGFAPVDDPALVIYVVVDEPNVEDQASSTYAQYIAQGILSEALPYLNVQPDEAEDGEVPTTELWDIFKGISDSATGSAADGQKEAISDENVPSPPEDDSEDEDTEDNNDMQSDGLTNEEAGLE